MLEKIGIDLFFDKGSIGEIVIVDLDDLQVDPLFFQLGFDVGEHLAMGNGRSGDFEHFCRVGLLPAAAGEKKE